MFFGLISYSLYLWHQPLLALYRVRAGEDASAAGLGMMVIASVAMGWISWRYVERPFRNRSFMTRARVLHSTVACLCLIGATGVFFVSSRGLVNRYPVHIGSLLAVSAAERGEYVRTRNRDEVRDQVFSGNQPRILLIGDSFSQDFYNVIRESDAFAGYQISADYIAARCQFHLDGAVPEGGIAPNDALRCATRDNQVNEFTLARAQEADIVLLAFVWRDWAALQLPQTLAGLSLREETQFIVIGSKYFANLGMRGLETMTVQDLSDYRSPLDPATAAVNAILAESPTEAQFVDVMDLLCDGPDSCRVFTPTGEMISHDNRHLTQEGARYLGSLLFSSDGPLSRFGRN